MSYRIISLMLCRRADPKPISVRTSLISSDNSPDLSDHRDPSLPPPLLDGVIVNSVSGDAEGETSESSGRWNKTEIDILIDWMRVPANLERYRTKPKIQTYRELSNLISTRDYKQIKNKLDSLEKKYKHAKGQTKQTGWGLYEDEETIRSNDFISLFFPTKFFS